MMNLKTPKKNINGILLLNKPEGMTSNFLLQKVKHLFQAKKAGHTGSLDPLATGMLPLCFGEATKFSQFLLDADKCYQVTGRLGVKTSTADAMGDPLAEVKQFSVSRERLVQVLQQFRGTIQQVPSMFSALKHQGRPLYHFARAGIDIERKAREIQIYELELLAFDGLDIELRVVCSKGTYIRNLIEDIGDVLETYAHVTKLHRIYTAGYEQHSMYSLEDMIQMTEPERLASLLPMDSAIQNLPKFELNQALLLDLYQGKTVRDSTAHGLSGLHRLYSAEAGFQGLVELHSNGLIAARRLLNQQ